MSEKTKLWLLKPRPELIAENKPYDKTNPWVNWYDRAYGFVVRAKSETKARQIADCYAGDENRSSGNLDELRRPWLDPKMTICDELTTDGKLGLIVRDYHAG